MTEQRHVVIDGHDRASFLQSVGAERAAWLEWRATGVGASDIAKAWTGIYGGLYSVVAEKRGLAESAIDHEDAARGHRWEQAIADGVHALTGYYVHGEQLWMTSPENKRWLATIDGLLDRKPTTTIDDAPAVLEVKTSRQHVRPKWDYYRAQVQWQMLVTGKQVALIAVAVIGVDPDGDETVTGLKLLWVERDDYLIGQLIDVAGIILGHMDDGTMPEPDEHTALADVRAVNREADETQTVDIDDVQETVAALDNGRTQLRALRRFVEALEAKVRHRMGEATEATTSDGRWRVRVGQPVRRFTDHSADAALLMHPEYGRTVLDRERFKAEHPGIYDELKTDTTDRRLTVKEMATDEQ